MCIDFQGVVTSVWNAPHLSVLLAAASRSRTNSRNGIKHMRRGGSVLSAGLINITDYGNAPIDVKGVTLIKMGQLSVGMR